MKKETLEEYLERGTEGIIEPNVKVLAKSYIRYGAKWQQERMYSEEDVLEIVQTFNDVCERPNKPHQIKNWFEQFKKK